MIRVSSAYHSISYFSRLIRECPPSHFVFLAGSGISVPSGLPSALDIGSTVSEFFAITSTGAQVLQKWIAPGGTSSGLNVALRFERLLQVVRDTGDSELALLRCLDRAKKPTGLHDFLAQMIVWGAWVFTTNFDCLIEQAYLSKKPDGPLCVIDRELNSRQCRNASFASVSKVHRSEKKHFLFKLHGSLHRFNSSATGCRRIGRWQTETINGTLDNIGNNALAAKLEANKERVLYRTLRGRTLVVLGYSGLDDFDIIPSLERAIRKGILRRILWIFHDASGRINLHRWSANLRLNTKLPGALGQAIQESRATAYVAQGKTSTVVQSLFRHPLPNAIIPMIPRFNSDALAKLEPYKDMSTSERRFAAGRLCESVGDFSHADTFYRQAIVDAGSVKERRALQVKGLAFSRRGYIRWLKGDNKKAFALWKQGFDFAQQARSPQAIAAITNQIGLAHMNRGELDDAFRQYHAALKLFRKLKNQPSIAKVLTNIGIIHRRRGELKKARLYYERALAVSTAIRDRDGMARDLGNLANIYHHQKCYKMALKKAEQSLKLATQLGNKQIMAVQIGNIGVYLRRLGRLNEALKALEQALDRNRAIGRSEGIRDAIAEMGVAYGEQHKCSKALRFLTRAIALNRKHEDIEGLAENLDHRGDVFSQQGQSRRAFNDWKASCKLFARLKNHTELNAIEQKLMKANNN
jgi:tetratricopeptide (TPR) repeat protein